MSNLESYDVSTQIVTAGNTGAATRVKISVFRNDHKRLQVTNACVRVKVAKTQSFADASNATIASSNGSVTLSTVTSTKDLVVSPAVATAHTGTLTVSGVVKHGETVTIGSRVYEFVAGAAAVEGRVAVDISAGTTAAAGTLTLPTQPTVNDVMTVGTRSYVFVALGTAENPGEIGLGANIAATQPLVVAAINGTDGWNTPNTKVTAGDFAEDVSILTSIIEGTVGNAIVTTENFTAVGNIFDGTTLGTAVLGVDCAAPAAVTALVRAITGDSQAVVSAVDGTGDTVDVAAKAPGTAAIASAETMATGAWGVGGISGGTNAAPGDIYVDITNAAAETVDLLVSSAPFGPSISAPARVQVTHAAP